MIYELHIRRGTFVNDDTQRRCYNGAYFSSRIDWQDWEKWMEYPSLEYAEAAVRVFSREDQKFKIVEVEGGS